MPNAWVPVREELSPSLSYGASLSGQPISKEFRITAGGSLHLVVAIKASGVTAGAGITATLQTCVGDYPWVSSKSVSITADGYYYIKLLAEASGDQTYLPLLGKGRVTLTTLAGAAVTIDSLYLLVED